MSLRAAKSACQATHPQGRDIGWEGNDAHGFPIHIYGKGKLNW